MLELRVRLFGTPEVHLGGRPVALQRRSAVALLAYLALTGRSHRREALAALLADDAAGDQAGRLLSNAVYELRGALGDHLLVTPQEVGLNPARPRWLDAAAFRAALTAALGAGDVRGIGAAADLHADGLLEGFALRDAPQFEAWLLQQQEELLVLLVRGLQAVVAHHARCGPPEAGIAAARRLLALEPWREEAHRQLMVLLARTGQRGAALKQYEICRRVLAAELATAPEAATDALAARLRAGPRAAPHNLPPHPIPFVGREAELDHIAVRLDDPACRLISLVGLGGSGKSSLAVQAARRFTDPAGGLGEHPFQDGVYLVPMAEVSPGATTEATRGRMTLAIASALGIALDEAGDPVAQLVSALRGRSVLLVLDNLEHLVDGVHVLWQLVRQAPGLKLLVTSRVRLRIFGEWELEVGGLPVPAGQEDVEWAGASLLFLQQARRVQPGLAADALSAADRAAVVRICQLVDGLPLPLVQVAAWASVQSCAEIAAELAAALDVPGVPLRGLPARQHRVRDILDAAWAQLPAADQAVLRWLPLFRGGFTREAARAVGGASPQQLLKLLDLFLVSAQGDGRYALNALVRRFVVDQPEAQPDERVRMAARYAAYYAGFVHERTATLRRSRQAMAEIKREIPNILSAWDWAASQGHAGLLERMRPGLQLFHQLTAPAAPGVDAAFPIWSVVPPDGAETQGGVLELAVATP
jgi:DNA-binding SARP family transcriptional activator/predicted ATPase